MSNHRNTIDSVSPTYAVVPNYNKHSHHESNRTSRNQETWNMEHSSFVQRGLGLFLLNDTRISPSLPNSNSASLYSASLCCCSDLALAHATCHALFCTSSPCSPRFPMATTYKTKINLAINDIYQSYLFFF